MRCILMRGTASRSWASDAAGAGIIALKSERLRLIISHCDRIAIKHPGVLGGTGPSRAETADSY